MQTSFNGISNQDLLLLNKSTHKKNPMIGKSSNNAKDDVSVGMLTPEKTQAILNHQLAEKLKARFKEEGIELKGLKADDFTPEKVSDRILGFVSGHILGASGQEKQLGLLSEARKGIEQGFKEARDILESLDVLNGKVKEDADKTYDLIQQGLARLENKIKGIEEEPEEDKTNLAIQEGRIQNSYARDEKTQVEIFTKDGDKVLIDIVKQQSGQSSRSFSQNEDGSSYSASRSLSAGVGISYQVQGEIDEDEQKAIDELLNDIAKVSDRFFAGDVQQAYRKAQELQIDSEELSRFSFNLNYQESRQVAINTYSTYQSQAQTPEESDSNDLALRDKQALGRFINDLDNLFKNPFANQKFANPQQAIGDLFYGMNHVLHSKEMNQLQQGSSNLLDSLVNQIKERNSEQTVARKEEE